jgi:hypothetical protein
MDSEDGHGACAAHMQHLLEAYSRPTAGHDMRTAVGEALVKIYGRQGPKGVKAKDLLTIVNRWLEEHKRSRVSMSTLLRARRAKFGW